MNDIASLTLEIDSRQVTTGHQELDKLDTSGKKAASTADAMRRSYDQLGNTMKGLTAALGIRELIRYTDTWTLLEGRIRLVTASTAEAARVQEQLFQVAQRTRVAYEGTADLYARIARSTQEMRRSQEDLLKVTETINKALIVSGENQQSAQSALIQLGQGFASGTLRGQELNSVMEQTPRLAQAIAEGLGITIGQLRKYAEEGKLTSESVFAAIQKSGASVQKEFAQMPRTIGQAFTQLNNELMKLIGTTSQTNGTVGLLTSGIDLLAKNLNVVLAVLGGLTTMKVAGWILEAAAAFKVKALAVIDSSNALAVERQSLLASAEASAAKTAASVAELRATQGTILAAREEALAKLATSQASITEAETTLAATAAVGAHSAALRLSTVATDQLNFAKARQAVLVSDLAALGAAQARVESQLTASLAAETAAQNALNAAKTGAAAGAGVLTRALGLLGGPIGIITTVLGIGVTAWSLWGSSAADAENKAKSAVQQSTEDMIQELNKQIEKLRERNNLAGLPVDLKRAAATDPKAARAAELLAEMGRAERGEGMYGLVKGEEARAAVVQSLAQQYGNLASAIKLEAIEKERSNEISKQSKLEQWIAKNQEYATTTEKIGAEIKKAKAELGDAFTPEIETRIRDKIMKQQVENGAKMGHEIAEARAKAEFEATKSGLDKQEALNDAYYKAGLVDVEKFYDTRSDIILDRLENEQAAIQKQIDVERARAGDPKTKPDARISAQTKIIELTQKMAEVEEKASVDYVKNQLDRQQAVNAWQAAVYTAIVEVMKAEEERDAKARDRWLELDKQFKDQREQAAFELEWAGKELQMYQGLSKGQGDVTKAQREYNIQKEIATRVRSLDIELMKEEAKLNAQDVNYLENLNRLRATYNEQRAAIPDQVRTQQQTQAQIDETKKVVDAQRQIYTDLWQDVDRVARDTFVSIQQSGKNTWERLRDSLKNTLYNLLYQMTLRPFLIQIMAQVTGQDPRNFAGAAGTLQSAGGGGGGFSLPGGGFGGNGLFGQLGSAVFGNSTAYAAAVPGLSFGGQQAAMLAEQTGVFGFEGLSATAGAGGSSLFGAGAATFSSVAPYIGAVIQALQGNIKGAAFTAAGAAIGSIIPGVGTAIGAVVGSLIGSLFGGGGKISARNLDSGSAGFDPAFPDAPIAGAGTQTAQDITKALVQQTRDFAAAIGATLPVFQIGYASNTGHQGQNPNFGIDASVGTSWADQRNVYRTGEWVSESERNPVNEANVNLRGLQAQLEVIKQADMPKYLKDFFDAVAPAKSLDAAAIKGVFEFAMQLKQAHEVLSQIIEISGLDTTADDLVKLFGNLQTALPLIQGYYANFFTASEKHAQSLKAVTEVMNALGIYVIPKTREEFRALVESQDMTTDSGKEMFRSLIAVAGMFAAVTEEIKDTTAELSDLQQALDQTRADAIKAIDEQIDQSRRSADSAREAAQAYREIQKSLDESRFNLRQGELSPLLPGQRLDEARTNLDEMFRRAISGDRDALGGLSGAASGFLEQSRGYNASGSQYQIDFDRVMRMLQEAGVASGQFAGSKDYDAQLLDIQTAALEALQEQLASDNPNLVEMQKQTNLLDAVKSLLGGHTSQLTTINSSVLDQTGQVIQGNSYIDTQTGEIRAVQRGIATQTDSLLMGSYTVTDPNTGDLLRVSIGSQGNMIEVRDAVTGAEKTISAGNTTITDSLGRVHEATVGAGGSITTRMNEQTAALLSGSYVVADPNTGRLVTLTTDQNGHIREVRDTVSGQTTSLLAGTYVVNDPNTGRVYEATVDQTGIVRGRLDDQIRQEIDSHRLIEAQTGEVQEVAGSIRDQTGEVIQGNSTADALRDLARVQNDFSEQMLRQMAEAQTNQGGTFQGMLDGLNTISELMHRLVGLEEHKAAEEAEADAREHAREEAAQRLGQAQRQLTTFEGQKETLMTSVNQGISEIFGLAAQYGLQLQDTDYTPAYFRVNQETGAFESNYNQIFGDPANFDAFRAEFWKPGGVYDRTFGQGGPLATLFSQIKAQEDLVKQLQDALAAIPSHAGGLDRVPYDGYLARLHVNERVQTADDVASGGRSPTGMSPVHVEALRAAMRETRVAIDRASKETAEAIREQTRELCTALKANTREAEFVRSNRESATKRN